MQSPSVSRGLQITETYTDAGVSGSNESRPALNRLMADACQRRFDAVLVWKPDRFGRSLRRVHESQIADLRHSGASWRKVAKKLGIGLGTAHSGSLGYDPEPRMARGWFGRMDRSSLQVSDIGV
jgi:site-specific DNA recombinase